MKKNKIVLIIFGILLIGSIVALVKYIIFTNKYISSDAVFVKSDTLTNLSFKLSGKIEKIYVNEGDNVRKGELLAKLDTKELLTKQKELKANINALKNKLEATKIQKEKLLNEINTNLQLLDVKKEKLQKNIESMAFYIDSMKYKLKKLKDDYEKFKRLYKNNKISKEKFENVKVAFFSLKDTIKSQEKKFQALLLDQNRLELQKKLIVNNKKEIIRLEKLINSQTNHLNALQEKLALINQKIKDSFLYAPFDGKVAKKFVNNDEVVPAGKMVLSVVNLKNLYVLDLLEETKLKDIKVGCKVKIHIDALDKDFDGVISKILPASAATFALVPRDISSGEFTKLAQRFYVKIRFNKVPKDVKVGMSGEVEIYKCKMESEK